MQPNKGLSGKDSFSTCQSADIFSHIRHPQMKLTKPADLESLDTLENEAVKKELELLKGLLEGQNSPFRLVLKGSKILFLALIFPARVLFFLIPKLVTRHILPKIAMLAKETSLTCQQGFNWIVQKIAIQTKVIMSLVEVLKPYHSILKLSFKGLTENFLSPFKKVMKFAKNEINSLAKPFLGMATFLNEIPKKLRSSYNSIKNLATKVTERVKQSETGKSAKASEFFLKTASLKFSSAAKQIYHSFSKTISHLTKSLKNSTQSKVLKVASFAKNAKAFVARLAKPVADFTKAQTKKVSQVLHEVKKRVTEAIAPKIKAIREVISHSIERLSQTFKPPVILAIAFIHQINQNAIHLFFNNSGVQILKAQYAVLKKITAKMQRVQTAILKTLDRLKKEVKESLKKMYAKAKKQGQKFKKKAIVILNNFKKSLKVLVIKILNFFTKVKRFFVIILRWCRIMIKFTGYLIREIFRELQAA